MKILSFCAFLMLLSPTKVGDVALGVDKVVQAEAVCFMDEWYVALVTEPIYLRSEGEGICREVKARLKEEYRVCAYVTIDVGLYYAIKEVKNSENSSEMLAKISKIFKNRSGYERYRDNQSQETRLCFV